MGVSQAGQSLDQRLEAPSRKNSKGDGPSRVECLGEGLVPTNLATMVVEDKPVGGAQEGVSVSTPPQGFHGECLPQDHMMSHYVRILRGRRSSGAPGLSGALDSGVPPTASLCQGIGGSPSEPSPLPLGHPCPSDLTRLLLLPWASRERFVGTKMV